MYRALKAPTGAPPAEPGWVYVGQDAERYYYQAVGPEGLAGLWGAIKTVAKRVARPVVSVVSAVVPGGGLIRSGVAALLEVVRTGTQKQVADAMAATMTAEQRAELERAYAERRARELAAAAGPAARVALPLLATAALVWYLTRR